jgi:hypothetical protein
MPALVITPEIKEAIEKIVAMYMPDEQRHYGEMYADSGEDEEPTTSADTNKDHILHALYVLEEAIAE